MIDRDIFEDLFVLEMANNHWGSLERGLKIIDDYAQVVRFNNVRAAIKLQFRDVDNFIHKDFRERTDIRYIKKTLDTQLAAGRLCGPGQGHPQGRLHSHGHALRRGLGRPLLRARHPDHQARQLRPERLGADREDRQDQEAGDRLHRRLFAQGHRRPGEVLRQPAHSAGDQPLRLALSHARTTSWR